MRILQVRFKNLNSLVGEWEIDFTHPAFTADGLFAITGPTGAGKSTVLDALCLALYGRTPRLGKITRSGNEIMSRQTGECFAEATFEASAGQGAGSGGAEARRFRCVWSQHRSRRRSDGELQAPKHEIADAVSGEVLESSITGVAARIEAVTGMDFDRFTRSMLLAQGGFAAFLQAPSDERAPVLEQITGTEIYSRISVRVHERRAEERAKRDLLRAELEGMRMLPEEEEARLRVELEERSLREKDMSGRIERTGLPSSGWTEWHALRRSCGDRRSGESAAGPVGAVFAPRRNGSVAPRMPWSSPRSTPPSCLFGRSNGGTGTFMQRR
jgi:exonuclease SbcC